MKILRFTSACLIAAIMAGSCGTMNKTGKGTLIGAGSGAALGAAIGGIAGKGKGAAIGAAIGTAVGAGTGAIIGRTMDKKAEEAAKIEGAEVEKITDSNGLTAVKVTFNSGILFAFNSSELSSSSQKALSDFAVILKEDPTIDIAVFGHTDKVGTYEANQKVSTDRAFSVQQYLQRCGVSASQFKEVKGLGYSQYDESLSADENRRVEVYMYASEEMIRNAKNSK